MGFGWEIAQKNKLSEWKSQSREARARIFLYLSAGKHESFSPVSGPLSFEQPEEAGVQMEIVSVGDFVFSFVRSYLNLGPYSCLDKSQRPVILISTLASLRATDSSVLKNSRQNLGFRNSILEIVVGVLPVVPSSSIFSLWIWKKRRQKREFQTGSQNTRPWLRD